MEEERRSSAKPNSYLETLISEMKKKTTSFVLLLFLLLVQSVNFSEQREALKPKVDKLLIVVLGG